MGRINKPLYWAPRVLGVAFALFISLFALDVFNGNHSFGRELLGFVVHLKFTAVIVRILVLAGKWEWAGFAGFVGWGAWYIWWTHLKYPLSVYVLMSGIAFLIGLLFLASWFLRHKLRPS
jgi:hypothetical protein